MKEHIATQAPEIGSARISTAYTVRFPAPSAPVMAGSMRRSRCSTTKSTGVEAKMSKTLETGEVLEMLGINKAVLAGHVHRGHLTYRLVQGKRKYRLEDVQSFASDYLKGKSRKASGGKAAGKKGAKDATKGSPGYKLSSLVVDMRVKLGAEVCKQLVKVLPGLPRNLNKADIARLEVLADLVAEGVSNPYRMLVEAIRGGNRIHVGK